LRENSTPFQWLNNCLNPSSPQTRVQKLALRVIDQRGPPVSTGPPRPFPSCPGTPPPKFIHVILSPPTPHRFRRRFGRAWASFMYRCQHGCFFPPLTFSVFFFPGSELPSCLIKWKTLQTRPVFESHPPPKTRVGEGFSFFLRIRYFGLLSIYLVLLCWLLFFFFSFGVGSRLPFVHYREFLFCAGCFEISVPLL